MKIIFSRKGFDSQYGGRPSPIFEDKTFFSLPIPYDEGMPFADVSYKCNNGKSMNLMDLLNELGGFKTKDETRLRKVEKNDCCHYDPDISDNVTIEKRDKTWQRGFGQKGSAQKLLEAENYEVEKGDIFIFFGTFKDVSEKNGTYKFKRGSKNRHVIFGWLQVGEILEINPDTNNKNDKNKYLSLKNHPHYNWDTHVNNVIYLPTENLSLNSEIKGYGTFEKYDYKLSLTKGNKNKSIWELPKCFHKDNGVKLSRHENEPWEKVEKDFFNLQTVPRGQEFVLNYDNAAQKTKDEIETWVKNLFV